MGSGTGSHPFKTVKDYDGWLKRIDAFSVWSRTVIERFRDGIKDDYVLPKILVRRMVKRTEAWETFCVTSIFRKR